jgi:hypothetical protein
MRHLATSLHLTRKLLRRLGAASLMSLALAGAATAATPAVLATVGGISSAENAIQASDGRIFVSSNGSLYQLRQSGSSWTKTTIPVQFQDGSSHACYYLGLTEYNAAVYVVCTENSLNIYAAKHLMALDLKAGTAALQEVGALGGVGLPNGLASDGFGHLYYANTGILYPGNVRRITLQGRFAMVSDQAVVQYVVENPNGLKINGGQLYVGTDSVVALGVTRVLRYPLNAGGLTGSGTQVVSGLTFFDDFSLLTGSGVLLADFLLGQVDDVNESNGQTVQSFAISQPTSATVISSGGASYLLVTQRAANQVSILSNPWGLKPR